MRSNKGLGEDKSDDHLRHLNCSLASGGGEAGTEQNKRKTSTGRVSVTQVCTVLNLEELSICVSVFVHACVHIVCMKLLLGSACLILNHLPPKERESQEQRLGKIGKALPRVELCHRLRDT